MTPTKLFYTQKKTWPCVIRPPVIFQRIPVSELGRAVGKKGQVPHASAHAHTHARGQTAFALCVRRVIRQPKLCVVVRQSTHTQCLDKWNIYRVGTSNKTKCTCLSLRPMRVNSYWWPAQPVCQCWSFALRIPWAVIQNKMKCQVDSENEQFAKSILNILNLM
jgi:hypothetical protein